MGIRSDIEEIEIEDEVNTDEDTNSGERQLRKRTSARKAESKNTKKTTRSGKLIDKEREEFLSQFDRNVSEREKRKQTKKHNYKEGRGMLSKILNNARN